MQVQLKLWTSPKNAVTWCKMLVSCVGCLQRTLDISRRFIENRDGTFDIYEPPRTTSTLLLDNSCGRQPILPAELKTFLKIGQ